MYNVVYKIVEFCQDFGIIEWQSFVSKDAFEVWRSHIDVRCEILALDVSKERAIEICSSKENLHTIITAKMGSLSREMSNITHEFKELSLSCEEKELRRMAEAVRGLSDDIRYLSYEIRKLESKIK